MDWMKKSYARLLIDNHITDLEPSLMSHFDPREYVRMVEMSGVDSSMVYACDHNGNCYYPTLVGHQHANIAGRDLFGEIVTLLRRRKIAPVAYYTVVFHNHSAKTHPDWQMCDVNGKEHEGRYWHSCPSASGYVEYTLRQLSEIAAYDVDGFFIDMTFWPKVCQCENCRTRYQLEYGEALPQVIDWSAPAWVRYQRARERWMAQFAQQITDHLKKQKPAASVTHQFSPVIAGWYLGQSSGIAKASDYASGDFYGNKHQHRLGTKIFASFTRNAPFEFMASRCVDLHDHTSSKSEEELFLHAATTLANGGAYFFIDAINPDGTLNSRVYEMFGRIVARLRPFKECIQSHVPVLTAEVGIYFSMPSFANDSARPVNLKELAESGLNMDTRDNPVVAEIIGTSVLLNRLKIPYRVITDPAQLSGCKTLIINNSAYLSEREVDGIRDFVREGGTLIATGLTSFYDLNGGTKGDFQLADVFGVCYAGTKTGRVNYVENRAGDMVSGNRPCPRVRANEAQVLGRLAEPYFDPDDAERYASIHSHPPATPGEYAGLTLHTYGRGKCYYLATSLLRLQQHSQQTFGAALLALAMPDRQIRVEGLPACVEVTLLRSTLHQALLVGMVNYQEELPGVAIRNPVRIQLTLPEGFAPCSLRRASDGAGVPFSIIGGRIQFEMDSLDVLEVMEISGRPEEKPL